MSRNSLVQEQDRIVTGGIDEFLETKIRNDLSEAAGSLQTELLKAAVDAGKNNAFTGLPEDMDDSVKFDIKTEAMELE